MASESEQGHVGCTAKRRTRLARPAFVGRSVKSLTNSNRRIRNRTYGGVGGADERLSPLSRSTKNDGLPTPGTGCHIPAGSVDISIHSPCCQSDRGPAESDSPALA